MSQLHLIYEHSPPINYLESWFIEVKAVTGTMLLSDNNWQILGHIDVLSRSEAAMATDPKKPNPKLTLITTGNTYIPPADIVREATRRNVAIWQAFVLEDTNSPSNDPLLTVGDEILLNPEVYSTPAVFAFPNIATLTAPKTPPMLVPGDPDPPEVQ